MYFDLIFKANRVFMSNSPFLDLKSNVHCHQRANIKVSAMEHFRGIFMG